MSKSLFQYTRLSGVQCPSHYFSTPGLSWGAMFKMTKNEFELIPDPDTYIFLKKLQETEFLIDIANPRINL